eukprot:13564_1
MISEDELPTACNLPSNDEKTGGDLEDVDLEAGDGGTNGGTGGENVLVANIKAIEEMQKKCPVHGRRHRSNRHRSRPVATSKTSTWKRVMEERMAGQVVKM